MGKILTTFEMRKILRTAITRKNKTLEKYQTLDSNEHNEQYAKNQLSGSDTCNSNDDNQATTENRDNGLSKTPANIKNETPRHDDFKREIVTQQSKAENFDNKIEKEQTKMTEEINELKDTFAR